MDRKSWQWPFLPSCYDTETDILTKRGFIPVADMTMEDVFATRSSRGCFEWERPTEITKNRYKGPMVHFEGLHVDSLVTPNHRMVYRRKRFWQRVTRHITSERIRSASVLQKAVTKYPDGEAGDRRVFEVPLGAESERNRDLCADYVVLSAPKRNIQDRTSKVLRIDIDTWVKFLALYLADGSCEGTTEGIVFGEEYRPYDQHFAVSEKLLEEFARDPFAIAERHSGSSYRVRISCKYDSAIRREVAELLAGIPVAWTPSDQGFQCGSKALWFALFGFGNSYTKFVPSAIKILPVSKLHLFVEWLKKTDGTVYENGHGEYTTVSARLADDIQTILVRLGHSIGLDMRPQISGATAYRIHFSFKSYAKISTATTRDYDGFVYCPRVPNFVVCLRRNCKVFLCGNSLRRQQTPLLKMSPYNLRRMSRTPVPRRAMNMIKGAIISLTADVRPIEGVEVKDKKEQAERIRIAKQIFHHPNNDDSLQTFTEQGLEDYLVLRCIRGRKLGLTVDPRRPLKMWPVNVESIRLMPAWTESTPDMPRYVQMTGLKGERGALAFYDDEMMYLKDNPSTDNPFGLGCMEIAFQSVNDFLGVQGMSGRAGTDQVHKTWLWWLSPQPDTTMQIVRRHIQNDLEGQAKISLISGAPKPDVVEVSPVVIEDLLIPWQEMLIRMIANGFNMSAMALGIEHDINRAVGETPE